MLRHQTTLASRHLVGIVTTASSVSQYGITWTFDRAYPVGQFVNGDWWVIGPVTVTTVTPAPGPVKADEVTPARPSLGVDSTLRNGSMVITTNTAANQGYDSRGLTYQAGLSITYPYTLSVNRSLISSISAFTNPSTCMIADIQFSSEKVVTKALKTAAVLTCLSVAPPADAFRPAYAGTNKQIYRASNLQWGLLKNLTPPVNTPLFSQYERYFQRPWLDHFDGNWVIYDFVPNDNQPAYGREMSRVVGTASLLLHTNATQAQKQTLAYGLIQYGIDLHGIMELGKGWTPDGGHACGRKWPVMFAGLMLGEPSFTPPSGWIFQEDMQTYYGTSYYNSQACWQCVVRSGTKQPYIEKLPSAWSSNEPLSDNYRRCCTIKAWAGQTLAALLMESKAAWNHNSYFENVDDWMRQTDLFAAYRQGYARPTDEKTSWDSFQNSFWAAYRDTAVPAQPDGVINQKWDVNANQWVTNPRS